MLGSRKPKLNQTALFTSPGAAVDERLKQRYGTNQKGNRIITGHNNSGFDPLVLLQRDQQLLEATICVYLQVSSSLGRIFIS